MTAPDRLAELVRTEGARILATLVRTVGDLAVAEDAVQDAVLAALTHWPRHGVPDEPRAWLTLAARRKAIDVLRREHARTDKEHQAAALAELRRPELPEESVVRDDQLRLLFTACHPAIAPDAQVALALRVLCGLDTGRVAAALLISDAAAAKRLTRARRKIADAAIAYRVPAHHELPDRLAAVCGVIAGLHAVGHAPPSGTAGVDADACAEAVRLARLVRQLLPDEAMPAGLLALLLFTEARRPARFDERGDVVLLDDQDRSRWDAAAVAEAQQLLAWSLRRTGGVADAYQLQAAIAAEHARAAAAGKVDRREIVRLYELLVAVAPSPAAALARAVAVAEVDGPAAGLALAQAVPPSPRQAAVRAELLARLGQTAAAVAALDESLAGEMTDAERRHRLRRRAELRAGAAAAADWAACAGDTSAWRPMRT